MLVRLKVAIDQQIPTHSRRRCHIGRGAPLFMKADCESDGALVPNDIENAGRKLVPNELDKQTDKHIHTHTHVNTHAQTHSALTHTHINASTHTYN